jgi:hypothetical protein
MPGFPADAQGNVIPVLPVVYGSSQEQAQTTAGAVALSINATGAGALLRVFGLGCDIFYKTGTSAVGIPTLADALVLSGSYMEVPVPSNHTHIRAAARSGSGIFRVEILG